MLKLRFTLNGEEKLVPLIGTEVRLGRSGDNEVVLPDYSVSRYHAAARREGDSWFIFDLKSTNGIQLNRNPVQSARLSPADQIKIGIFELLVEELEETMTTPDTAGPRSFAASDRPPSSPPSTGLPPKDPPHEASRRSTPPASFSEPGVDMALSNATIVRSLSDFTADYGLDGKSQSSAARLDKRRALDEAYASQVFGFLTRLARLLITTDSVDEVMRHVMEIAFEILPVDRGFILLRDEDGGDLSCELMRINDRVELRPEGDIPISQTMLESVMRERVALLTYDALSDQRLAGTESVRIHQIRAAMCAPLWSGEKIIGVMQLDTPHHTGTFTEQDIDLVTALANYCAVAIERIRNGRKAEFERHVRSRLERYHSPSVIEDVLQQDTSAADEKMHSLKQAEVTVLFADIVGFTAFSEEAQPKEVAELMESYFTHAVEAIFEAGGTLDKFIGDCVMAFFGAPMPQSDHAHRAVSAAIQICRALDEWNQERGRAGLPQIATRIGINSGPVVVGDIGSNRRVDYTVLGNTVNVAARLEESVAKAGDIVIGSETSSMLAGRVPIESLGEVRLKGLSRSIPAFKVLWNT